MPAREHQVVVGAGGRAHEFERHESGRLLDHPGAAGEALLAAPRFVPDLGEVDKHVRALESFALNTPNEIKDWNKNLSKLWDKGLELVEHGVDRQRAIELVRQGVSSRRRSAGLASCG